MNILIDSGYSFLATLAVMAFVMPYVTGIYDKWALNLYKAYRRWLRGPVIVVVKDLGCGVMIVRRARRSQVAID